MQTYLEFIESQEQKTREIIIILDEFLLSFPGVSRKMRYRIPFYDYHEWICYINPQKNNFLIELVFLNGVELASIFPILKKKGRKMVAGIEINKLDDNLLMDISEIVTYQIQQPR